MRLQGLTEAVISSHYMNKFASCDSFLDDILVIFIGRNIFFNVNKDDIVEIEDFMVMGKHRLKEKK